MFLYSPHLLDRFMQGVESGEGRPYHGVPYREHSFLTNTRLSPRIRDSNVSVHFADPADVGGAPSASSSAYGATVSLPRGATDVEILRALGPGTAHDRAAVVYLDDAENVLGGFEDAAAGNFIRSLLDQKARALISTPEAFGLRSCRGDWSGGGSLAHAIYTHCCLPAALPPYLLACLLPPQVLYGSWCCSRTNFHMPGATAFFKTPPHLPTGALATDKRREREKQR